MSTTAEPPEDGQPENEEAVAERRAQEKALQRRIRSEGVDATDPTTGEIVKIKPELPPPPALQVQVARRQTMPKLETPQQVYSELERELWKLDLLGRRMTEVLMLIHGYYTPNGDYVAGANFEWAEEFDRLVSALYNECNDMSVDKAVRKKWPGADVRESLVNQTMSHDFRQRKQALEGEKKSLEEYRRITEQRASALQSLLAYRREEAVLAGRYPGRSGMEGGGQ